MNVKIFSNDETDLDECEFDSYLRIEVDDKEVFSVLEGRPNDNMLHKNFSDCYKIPSLIKMAYEAGKRNEELILLNR